jgi:hypothetical protein
VRRLFPFKYTKCLLTHPYLSDRSSPCPRLLLVTHSVRPSYPPVFPFSYGPPHPLCFAGRRSRRRTNAQEKREEFFFGKGNVPTQTHTHTTPNPLASAVLAGQPRRWENGKGAQVSGARKVERGTMCVTPAFLEVRRGEGREGEG